MLTIKKKFPVTKNYIYGLSAFIVGYGVVAYFLVTLPQRSTFNSIANLQSSSKVAGQEEAASNDVKPETPVSTDTTASKNAVVSQPASNTGSIPVTSSPSDTGTGSGSDTTPSTPVVTVPEVPVIIPEVPVPVDPLPEIPIVDPLLYGVLRVVDSADVSATISI